MTSRFKQVLLEKARDALAEAVLEQVLKNGLNETFQGLDMNKRSRRVNRVIKGRDKQIKKADSRGALGNMLTGKAPGDYTPRNPEALERARDKQRHIVNLRGRDASEDRAEKMRRGGGVWTSDGERRTKELKAERRKRGESGAQDSDEYRDDLPPSRRILRRRDKVDRQIQNKKDSEAEEARLAQEKRKKAEEKWRAEGRAKWPNYGRGPIKPRRRSISDEIDYF